MGLWPGFGLVHGTGAGARRVTGDGTLCRAGAGLVPRLYRKLGLGLGLGLGLAGAAASIGAGDHAEAMSWVGAWVEATTRALGSTGAEAGT